MSKCLSLWPSSLCGAHGHCVNNTCVCDIGWTQTKEFNFYVEDDELQTGLCNYNEKIINSIYGINLVFAVVCILVQLSTIERKKQIKRAVPALVLFSLSILISSWRLLDPSAVVTENVPFTFVFANLTLLICLLDHIAGHRLHIYLSSTFPFILEKGNARKYGDYFLKIFPYFVVMDIITLQLWWIGIFLETKLALICFRASLVWAVIRYLYGFLNIYLLKVYIMDMQSVISLKLRSNNDIPSPVVAKMQTILPFAIRIRRAKIMFPLLTWPMYALPIIWNLWLQNLGYLFPLVFLVVKASILVEMISSYQKRSAMRTNILSDPLDVDVEPVDTVSFSGMLPATLTTEKDQTV
mmetsp:Transcript_5210/g.6809  ORF Transcript_5210/g.6809 Transcript_5210/m.6809 type:complete len:353 (-) Transcript_5210:392-1450(-)